MHMKTGKIWGTLCGLLCLATMMGLGACENDEPAAPVLTDISELTTRTFYNYGSEPNLTVRVNGTDTLMLAEMQPWAEDTTKLVLTMWGKHVTNSFLLPAVVVTPVPDIHQVTFEGETETDLCAVSVKGVFDEWEETLNLDVDVQLAMPEFADREYVFHFGPECFRILGSHWDANDLEYMEEMLPKIGNRLAESYDEMKLVFHSDYTYDWLLKPAGESDYWPISSYRYWPYVNQKNRLALFLGYNEPDKATYNTPARAAELRFYEAFAGGEPDSYGPAVMDGYIAFDYWFDEAGQLMLSLNAYTLCTLPSVAYLYGVQEGTLSAEELENLRRIDAILDYERNRHLIHESNSDYYRVFESDWAFGHTSDETRDI